MPSRPEHASQFHALHADFLILPNAWDALSARLIERAGARAIATSSAAVAWSHGFADGHHLPFEKLRQTVLEIARVCPLPITADSEAGYSDDPAHVGENVAALIDAGAVGVNLEDGAGAHELHLRKIEAARGAAVRAGVDLFINARTDVFLAKLAPPERAVEETIRRARAFRGAGASGVFVPLAVSRADIAAIAAAVDLPLNVIACPGLPHASELKQLGVRRLSAGTALARAAVTAVQAAAERFIANGDSGGLLAVGGGAPNLNALFTR